MMNKKIGYCITCCTMVFAMGTIGFMATASAYEIGSFVVPAGADGAPGTCAASVDGTTCGPNETVKCQDPEKSGVKYTITGCDGETSNVHYVYDGPAGATGAQGAQGCGVTVTTSRTQTGTTATFKNACTGDKIDEFTVADGQDGQGICDNADENATQNTIKVYTAGNERAMGYTTYTEIKCNGTQAISKQFDSCFPVADTRTSNQCTGTYLQCTNPNDSIYNDSIYYVCEQPNTSDNVESLTSAIQNNTNSINGLTNTLATKVDITAFDAYKDTVTDTLATKVDITAFDAYKDQVDADIAAAAAAAAAGLDVEQVEGMINTAVTNKVADATAGLATDADLNALQNEVTTNGNNIAALQTSKADKTALNDYVKTSDLVDYATIADVVNATMCEGTIGTREEDIGNNTTRVTITCDDGKN